MNDIKDNFIAMLRQTPQPLTEIKNSEQTKIESK
jgi:hypothetical protein